MRSQKEVSALPRARAPLQLPVSSAAAVALLFLMAGPSCQHDLAVATALSVDGTAERDHEGATTAVSPGANFTVGDTLRTGSESQLRLDIIAGGVLRVGERAKIRFQRGGIAGRRAPEIAVELGSAEVEEATHEWSLLTPLGPTRVPRGARVQVHADGRTASLDVIVGRAIVLADGHEIEVEAGQGIRIKIGDPEIQRFALKVGEAIVEERHGTGTETTPKTAPTPAPPERAEDAAANQSNERRADVTLAAGESATVHLGRLPALVRLRFKGLCAGDAVVEMGGAPPTARMAGSESVVLRLPAGTRSYRVRCSDDPKGAAPRAVGSLTIRHDTGYLPLARRAPVNVIDADGRRYTVMFQTRLPQLTLSWPAAPVALASLELHVESPAGERVLEANPHQALPAGTIQEGTYTLWYRAPDGIQSPKTTLTVRFDNAAPTAQFFHVARSDEDAAHDALLIDGVTLEGSKVSVGGEPLRVDAQGRFRVAAKPVEGDDAVAVRLEHPRLGVHYYVRRKADAR